MASTASQASTVSRRSPPIVSPGTARAATCTSIPTRTNRALLRKNVESDQNAKLCWRACGVLTRGPDWLSARPAITTATTPDASTSSAKRNAANGTSTSTALFAMGSRILRMSIVPIQPNAPPIAAPPRYASATRPVISHPVYSIWLTPTPTAMLKMTSAVPSFIRLSARKTVMLRWGSVRAIAPTAVASVGASAAPRISAAPQVRPSAVAIPATPNAVATTSSVERRRIPRRSRRISRSDVVRLSQNRSAGRNSTSTASDGSCTSCTWGTNPATIPKRSISSGVGIRSRGATTDPTMMIAPMSTMIWRASILVPCGCTW